MWHTFDLEFPPKPTAQIRRVVNAQPQKKRIAINFIKLGGRIVAR
jgi:hypothetical protein